METTSLSTTTQSIQCVDVPTLQDAKIARESGLCVHLVGFGYRIHKTGCSK